MILDLMPALKFMKTLLTAGVIDPTKVTRIALENAASIAGMLLTTECVVATNLRKKNQLCLQWAAVEWVTWVIKSLMYDLRCMMYDVKNTIPLQQCKGIFIWGSHR